MDAEGLHLLDLLQAVDAAFDELETTLGHFLDQGDGLIPGSLPGVEVPADSADDVGTRLDGPAQLCFRCDLHHHVKTLAGGEFQQRLKTFLRQQGRHEEDGIGAKDLALLDLVFLEYEFPSDKRQLHLAPHLGKVFVLAEVEELVRGHREGPGTVLDQTLGVSRGLVGLPDLSAAGIAAGNFT